MKRGRRLFFRLFFCLLAVLAACSPPSRVDGEARLVRIGYSPMAGYLFRDGNGQLQGMAYDLLETVSVYADTRMEYVEGSPEECLERLNNGSIDAIAGVLESTEAAGALDFVRQLLSKTIVSLSLRGGEEAFSISRPLRIGYPVPSYSREEIVGALQDRGYTQKASFELIPYPAGANLMHDYLSGTLDGQLTTEFPLLAGDATPTDRLMLVNSCLVVKKGNAGLRSLFERALVSLLLVDPYFRGHLYDKYAENARPLGRPLLLTQEEKDYLKQHPIITALSAPGQKPYTYFLDGQHLGALHDILQVMGRDLGVEFNVLEIHSNEEMLEEFAQGKADAVVDFFADHNWAQDNHANLTFPYATMDYVPVVRQGEKLPERPRVACLRGHYYTKKFIERDYPENQLMYFDTVQACLQAVSDGDADMVFLRAVTVQDSTQDGGFYNLMANSTVAFSHQVAIAVSDSVDPMLVRILNKEIAHLGHERVQAIIHRNVFNTQWHMSMRAYLYRNPVKSIAAIGLLAGFIIFMLLFYLYKRREAMARIRQIAFTNDLTGRHNLHWFEENIPDKIHALQGEREAGRLFIMLLGIRRLDLMKERYDRKIIVAAITQQIQDIRQNNPWILEDGLSSEMTRMFSLCCLPEGREIEELAGEMVEKFSAVHIEDVSIRFRYFIGICRIPQDNHLTLQSLMDFAEIAQTEGADKDRTVTVYGEKLQDEIIFQQKMESLMGKALREEEFQLWIQPKYNIRTHEVIGGEALVRWQSPELGFLMPGKFIELFEKNNFAVQLDYYMLEHVFRMQKRRLADGLPVVPVSVNQSGLHIVEEGYLERMRGIVDKYRLPPGTVELELTETAFIDFSAKNEHQSAREILEQLRAMGFSTSMDDFCTGYSSIAMLQNLPMDVMKIDRSLLLAAEKSPRAKTILRGVIDLGQSLDMQVLCEGIETTEQENMLLENNCLFGQGYFFSKPIPQAEFEDFLATHPLEGTTQGDAAL